MVNIVTDEMKEQIAVMDKKGMSNREIGNKLGIKCATAGYWKTKLRKNGNGKKRPVLSTPTVAMNEKRLNECFREEFIVGFVNFNDKTYIATSSGIALEVKGEISMISKEEMDSIKRAIKIQLEQARNRMAFITEMESLTGEKSHIETEDV